MIQSWTLVFIRTICVVGPRLEHVPDICLSYRPAFRSTEAPAEIGPLMYRVIQEIVKSQMVNSYDMNIISEITRTCFYRVHLYYWLLSPNILTSIYNTFILCAAWQQRWGLEISGTLLTFSTTRINILIATSNKNNILSIWIQMHNGVCVRLSQLVGVWNILV